MAVLPGAREIAILSLSGSGCRTLLPFVCVIVRIRCGRGIGEA